MSVKPPPKYSDTPTGRARLEAAAARYLASKAGGAAASPAQAVTPSASPASELLHLQPFSYEAVEGDAATDHWKRITELASYITVRYPYEPKPTIEFTDKLEAGWLGSLISSGREIGSGVVLQFPHLEITFPNDGDSFVNHEKRFLAFAKAAGFYNENKVIVQRGEGDDDKYRYFVYCSEDRNGGDDTRFKED
jgi:hypothetical protein